MKNTKSYFWLKLFIIIVVFGFSNCKNKELKSDWQSEDGYIPNKDSAIKMAEIVWLNVYGPNIINEKPFHAELKDGKIWVVSGTLKAGYDGGVASIEIQKSDGKILNVIHGK
jgi:hypothetical protein